MTVVLALSRGQQRIAWTAGLLLVWLLVVWLMLRSRALRRRRDAALPALPDVPDDAGDDLAPAFEGACLGTTRAGEWLDRVFVGGIEERAAVHARLLPEGIAVDPPRVLIPAAALVRARLDEAHGGKVIGEGGVLVVTWRSGDEELETGFRARHAEAHAAWRRAINELARSARDTAEVAEPEPEPAAEPAGDEPAPVTVAAAPGVPALVGRARPPALLVLEDGRAFHGDTYGATGATSGEAVFNTGMTGYQETLTDPSYHRQVVVMTAPHIGNTGVNGIDAESARIWVSGYVVRDPSRLASNWRATGGLEAALRAQGVVGISGVDTRAITRHLRDRGAMRCAIDSTGAGVDEVLARVLASPDMTGADLAREVTTPAPYVVPATGERRFRVAAIDLGIKRSIPAYLAQQGCEVHVLPATATTADMLAIQPDGVFLSNGPGDPAATEYAVDALRGVLGQVPVFGICLGHQLLGRALGLGTYKLRFGHRGVNQPVQDLATGRVAITSHNHGFAVAPPADGGLELATPYGRVAISHVDLNDGVVEGLRCLDLPAFSVQYHPEAAPGPHDATGLFAEFASLMERVGASR